MSDEHPTKFVCPITGDIMRSPITYTIDGHPYTFEQSAIDIWKTTPNGDKNPLTMIPGLRECIPTQNDTLKTQIDEYLISIGEDPNTKPNIPVIEPFSDFQQIQDDEDVARRLNIELNGPPPTQISPQIIRDIDYIYRHILNSNPTRTLDIMDLVDMLNEQPDNGQDEELYDEQDEVDEQDEDEVDEQDEDEVEIINIVPLDFPPYIPINTTQFVIYYNISNFINIQND